jgi:hypothetical protein
MRLPSLRSRIGRIAVALGLAGMASGAAVRGAWYLWLSAKYRALSEKHAALAERAPMSRGHFRGPRGTYRDIEWSSPEREHHRRLKQKYDEAATHPWLPVEPDPQEPE